MHKKTWREFGKRMNPHKSWSECWPGDHTGRYVKRRLSKARRQYAKQLCLYEQFDIAPHTRGLPGAEGEANWKTW